MRSVSLRGGYDLAIVACGYERRSSFMLDVANVEAERKVAFGYGQNEVIAFSENHRRLSAAGFIFIRCLDEDFEHKLRAEVAALGAIGRRAAVLVDISCLTRYRLASLIRCFMGAQVDVDFFYSIAAYAPPNADEPVSEHVGPASEYLSGWSGEYTNPTAVISGLGYEHMKALGVIELLDPASSWLFVPVSPIAKYDDAVEHANSLLLRDVDESCVIRYDVLDGPALIRDLFALVAHLRTSHRCVLLPLGPKIFAFCAMLAGAHFRDISVWRVSAGRFANPVDRAASGRYTTFRVTFEVPDP